MPLLGTREGVFFYWKLFKEVNVGDERPTFLVPTIFFPKILTRDVSFKKLLNSFMQNEARNDQGHKRRYLQSLLNNCFIKQSQFEGLGPQHLYPNFPRMPPTSPPPEQAPQS